MTRRTIPFLFEHYFCAWLQGASGEAVARRGPAWVPALSLLAAVFGVALFVEPAIAQTEPKPPATYPALPSEIPAKFTRTNDGFDYVKRDVMIPMRDGVKLHTIILIPKGAARADSPHPDALRRQQAHQPCRKRSPRAGPERLRQPLGGDPRGGVPARRAGRARQARFRG